MITCIVGTNRPNSHSRRLAAELQQTYARLDRPFELLDLADLPPELMLPTAYAQKPPGFARFSERILAASGLVVIAAEYNGSFPGILKLFIDHLPFPQSFDLRPVCFVGLSAGMWGGLRAVEQLQGIFGYRNAHVYPERVFIPQSHTVFDPEGRIRSDELRARLERQARGFLNFIDALSEHPATR